VWPSLLSRGDRAALLLALGVLGLGALLAGVAGGWATAVAAGVFLLGGAYVTHLVLDDPPLDARAALYGGGLLLAAELGCWSGELRRERTTETGRALRRLVAELGLCVGGLAISALVLAAADIGRVGGVVIEVVGAIAAGALLWLALQALRRPAA
jgi:hypothetical protein